MVSILTVHNSKRCIGRCDKTCYDAKNIECTCICGGRNHGMGIDRAGKNAANLVGLKPDDLKRYAEAKGLDVAELYVSDRVRNPVPHKASALVRRHFNRKPREPDMIDKLRGDQPVHR